MSDEALRKLAGSVVMVGFRGLTATPDTMIHRQIQSLNLAGVILFDIDVSTRSPGRNIVGPDQLRELTSQLQSAAGYPLLIAIDQEGGRVARLNPNNGHPATPSHGELGSGENVTTTRRQAATMARCLAAAGINLNFAPVVDVNTNPQNSIIGMAQRSFSSKAAEVISHARAFIQAHHDDHIACALKHFPGHGSAAGDTHQGAVDVTQTFDLAELEPYRVLIQEGLAELIMSAHVIHRGYDPDCPASLSHPVIQKLLRKELGFQGVVVSDDLDMAAAANYFSLPQRVALALNAGVDLLLFGNNLAYDPERPVQVVDAIVQSIKSGQVSVECLNQHALRLDRLRWNRIGKSIQPRQTIPPLIRTESARVFLT